VLAEYRELWQAMPQTGLRGMRVSAGEMTGVLIERAEDFLLGIGQAPNGTSEALISALENDKADSGALHRHFSGGYILGKWDGPAGIATLATNPFCEGQVMLERDAGLVWHSLAFDGQRSARRLTLA
ncbi:MAG: hypothetical protein P1U53_16890, partial [Sulfitobacter sp.]|nr:hypothetical protein [Sulfitobacter sp.]